MENYRKIINQEIAELTVPLMQSGVVIKKVDIIQQVITNHREELGSDFAHYCAYKTLTDTVNRFFRDNLENGVTSDNIDNQLTIPGKEFDRVQRYYSIERDGDKCAVAVYDLNQEDVQKIVNELLSKSKGLQEHARQLQEFYNLKIAV